MLTTKASSLSAAKQSYAQPGLMVGLAQFPWGNLDSRKKFSETHHSLLKVLRVTKYLGDSQIHL